jgi:hypothetical protein
MSLVRFYDNHPEDPFCKTREEKSRRSNRDSAQECACLQLTLLPISPDIRDSKWCKGVTGPTVTRKNQTEYHQLMFQWDPTILRTVLAIIFPEQFLCG